MKNKDEAERLSDAYKSQGLKNSWRVNFKTGFHAGEKSEKVMRLVEALKFYAFIQPQQFPEGYYEPHYSPGVGGHDRFGTRANKALAAFNASPEEG